MGIWRHLPRTVPAVSSWTAHAVPIGEFACRAVPIDELRFESRPLTRRLP